MYHLEGSSSGFLKPNIESKTAHVCIFLGTGCIGLSHYKREIKWSAEGQEKTLVFLQSGAHIRQNVTQKSRPELQAGILGSRLVYYKPEAPHQ